MFKKSMLLVISKILVLLTVAGYCEDDIIEISTEIEEEGYIPFLLSKGRSQVGDLVEYTLKMNPYLESEYVQMIAQTYIDEALIEGINCDIAYAQMLLETGILRFNGIVSKEQHNFSGIGATDNVTKGNSFSNIKEGIRAHIQHLKAYASRQDINSNMVDPRFYLVKRGSAPTIYDLTGKWAQDKLYDKKLKKILIRLLAFNDAKS
ncbi:glucosaminidase domain-containing protein [Borrelia sp. BU AG58]|uniref:glucosaminidase domain-containing protein n=1 Tax=Borrelia sp. BU AG58 TaxID=2887345 RepID=UPI00359487C7